MKAVDTFNCLSEKGHEVSCLEDFCYVSLP